MINNRAKKIELAMSLLDMNVVLEEQIANSIDIKDLDKTCENLCKIIDNATISETCLENYYSYLVNNNMASLGCSLNKEQLKQLLTNEDLNIETDQQQYIISVSNTSTYTQQCINTLIYYLMMVCNYRNDNFDLKYELFDILLMRHFDGISIYTDMLQSRNIAVISLPKPTIRNKDYNNYLMLLLKSRKFYGLTTLLVTDKDHLSYSKDDILYYDVDEIYQLGYKSLDSLISNLSFSLINNCKDAI